MTAPVFFADDIADASGTYTLSGSEAHHVNVHRLRVGDDIDLVDGNGMRAQCTITAVDKHDVTVRIDAMSCEDRPRPAITLVQALAKGGRDEAAIEMATEVGVDSVIAWQAQRSIAKWPAAKRAKAQAKWENTLKAATKQSRRSRIPALSYAPDTKTLLQQLEGARVLVLHESASERLENLDAAWVNSQEIAVVVGPEGGITDDELDAFAQAGAKVVRIGTTVMRSSTAGTVAIAVLNHITARMRLDIGESGYSD
ncbi:MAG: 16S rRNA (uracil(1498)-N(3))-methyltransferase [Actinomycetaceae bacterium]|nr:16S rRNA (uracil(1498)-N(3))-methyltransferase [Actinomycetaceae bacterium]